MNNGAFEENIMAMLDSSGVKQASDLHDDRLSFLEAVRAAALEFAIAPSWNMCNAIFQILRDSKSLELAMESFLLLTDITKWNPRVYLNSDSELVVVKEAWSPFTSGLEASRSDTNGNPKDTSNLIDPLKFANLVECIAQSVNETKCQLVSKTVDDMLLLQYLVNVIGADLLPRQTLYNETLDWVLLRESILHILTISRKVSLKSLVRNCMMIISNRGHHHARLQNLNDHNSAKIAPDCDIALRIAVVEQENETCIAVQKLLTLIMELDVIRGRADELGHTSRVDGLRIPVLETVVDELTYSKDLISPFLMVFSDPRWKFELILQYFSKYHKQPSVRTRRRTRRSSDSSAASTFDGVLSCFSTPESTRAIVKKITPGTAQLLLALAFQAYLSLKNLNLIATYSERIGDITLPQTCNSLISAFQNIQTINNDMDVTSFEKEALFTAKMILSCATGK